MYYLNLPSVSEGLDLCISPSRIFLFLNAQRSGNGLMPYKFELLGEPTAFIEAIGICGAKLETAVAGDSSLLNAWKQDFYIDGLRPLYGKVMLESTYHVRLEIRELHCDGPLIFEHALVYQHLVEIAQRISAFWNDVKKTREGTSQAYAYGDCAELWKV